ncbi:hypothetical protein RhiirA5_506800 [Rhizophagus irregularis]|uniref:Uncharacterized protein n=1 Tax=Rhizophagus irregularis TaxID=588596 RepID=A0A2N0NQR9_9GLOM|nr:hypothetical protein RhiirA5_506800 [Rhizophagus irregularis]
MSSELEVLKQRIIELEAKNAELEAEKAELLKRIMEENTRRDVRVEELEQKNKELETRLAIVEQASLPVEEQTYNDNPSDNSTSNFNSVVTEYHKKPLVDVETDNFLMANGKSLEEKDMDSFLLEAHKKIVSSEIKQCNKEKKLLCESAFLKVLPSAGNNPTVSLGNDKIESSTKTVSSGNDQMVSEKSEKIEKTSRNQQKSGSIIALLSEISEQYSSSCEASYGQITTQSLIHLFRNATRAGHEEILSWVYYSDNFENEVVEIRRETGVTDKTARTQIYKEMLEHLAGVTPVALRIKTLRAKKVHKIVWREWYQVTSKTVSLGNDQSHVPLKTINGNASSKLASTAPDPSTHVSAEGAKGNNSLNDSSRNGSKNIPKANDDLMPTSMEKRTNEVKRSLREASKRRDQTDDDSDCSHDSDSEEERLDDSDDGYNGYGGYGGYNEYDKWGNHDRGYYYHNGRRERKTSPMMSPIISPVTA